MAKVIRLILLFMLFLTIQSGIAATTEFTVHQYDVNHIVLGEEIYSYDTTSNPRCCRTPSVVKDQDRSLLAFVSDLLVPKSTDGIFKAGRTPKASELKQYAEGQGWKPTQTDGGPLKYVDENGIPRVTIKQGSSRAPGSGNPHAELKDATGQRIDRAGNPVTRKSPGNHTPIDYDL